MAEIEKAPLSLAPEYTPSVMAVLTRQRDADHKYYLREFIIWLRTQGAEVSMESEALFSLRNGIFISLDKLGLLQKEMEG